LVTVSVKSFGVFRVSEKMKEAKNFLEISLLKVYAPLWLWSYVNINIKPERSPKCLH
jgi:hypothetical protein